MKAEQYPYRSQHCVLDHHDACAHWFGEKIRRECTCPCGHKKPVQELIVFVPETLPSPSRLLDPAPLLQAVWLGTETLAFTEQENVA